MATYTTSTTGNWSNSATWVGGAPTGGPGTNDTVVFGGPHTLTVDSNAGISQDGVVIIGGGSGTAITGPGSYTVGGPGGSGVLTIANGCQLTVRGSIIAQSGGWILINVGTTAGATLIFSPATSTTQLTMDGTGGWGLYFSAHGTTGQHAVVRTDFTEAGGSGYNTYMNVSNGSGLYQVSYTDFTNFGDTTHYGLASQGTGTVINSITHNTFTNCSYKFDSAQDPQLSFTFSNNKFASSAAFSSAAGDACVYFSTPVPTTGSSIIIDGNSFDLVVYCPYWSNYMFTNNYCGALVYIGGSLSWPSSANFSGNFIAEPATIYPMTMRGSFQDCYFFHKQTNNPHYLSMVHGATSVVITGALFESIGNATGDIIIPSDNGGTLNVSNCIVLPNSSGNGGGELLSCLNVGAIAITVEHNTYCSMNDEGGMIHLDETASSYAGEIASCRANIIWRPSATTNGYVIADQGSGTIALDAVTIAGYNGFLNPSTGTCVHSGSPGTSQSGVVGYNGVKVTATGAWPNNAQIGGGDFTADPQFVDATRNLLTWGTTILGGGIDTYDEVLAALAANPALINQADTGLIPWVRAGYRPQSIEYHGTSYSTDSSTTDAAGTSWTGTYPDVGAMAYLAPTPTATAASLMMDF